MNRRPQTEPANTEMTKRSKKIKKNKAKYSVGDEDDEELKKMCDSENNDNQVKVIRPASHIAPNAKKDLHNIALLLFLYFLQGVPLGLTSSLPFILSSRKVSYADQGTFSFALWPFSLKLLWAPIVDSIFFKKIGRRKSWLIPIQYLIGIFMLTFSDYTKHLLEGNGSHSEIFKLTAIFFGFTFLAATQDIAVDGWALTMLSKENVSWGSTCNSVGQTAGWFIGNVIFLTLESADFSNKYVRPLFGLNEQKFGLLPIDKFMNCFGIVFIVATTLVFIFKKETEPVAEDTVQLKEDDEDEEEKSIEENLTVTETYKLMWKILWLIPIKKIILILMTVKIGFAAESMNFLKIIEAGVPKEKLSLMAIPLTPLQIVLPLLISRYTNGPNPLNFFIKAIPFRLLMGVVIAAWVYVTPYFKESNNEYPLYYYAICLVLNLVHSVFAYSMFVSQMSFFAQISDKAIGGTYMTLLNTISNLGGNWPSTAALYIASFLTLKTCSLNESSPLFESNKNLTLSNKCDSDQASNECTKLGGTCITWLDAYYVETFIFTIFGIIWIIKFRKIMFNLQGLPNSAWKITR